ncbi:MAG: Smr/MutS family protein [Clostridia bacterium]|nr:Smr/MutS family protein [Clostridia bacterium]
MSFSYSLDLHGHTVESARRLLTETLRSLPAEVRELEVIHGYHQGTAIREMIRSFKHPRIERKILGMNQGSTIFELKAK